MSKYLILRDGRKSWRYPKELLTAEQRELYDRTNDTCVIRDNPKAESK
jgi:hypothetical protein